MNMLLEYKIKYYKRSKIKHDKWSDKYFFLKYLYFLKTFSNYSLSLSLSYIHIVTTIHVVWEIQLLVSWSLSLSLSLSPWYLLPTSCVIAWFLTILFCFDWRFHIVASCFVLIDWWLYIVDACFFLSIDDSISLRHVLFWSIDDLICWGMFSFDWLLILYHGWMSKHCIYIMYINTDAYITSQWWNYYSI